MCSLLSRSTASGSWAAAPEWQTDGTVQISALRDMAGVAAAASVDCWNSSPQPTPHVRRGIREIVSDWIEGSRDPTSGKPYTAHIFQPMVELIDYLKGERVRSLIVSGGGVEFIRPVD